MIFTDRKITIRNGKSTINEPVILYRGDYEVSIRFTIMESKFRFKSGVNLVDSEKASHGQLAILTPYGGNVFSEIVKCEDGTVTFTLTKEMIDQLEEVGLYSFQIRLFDYYRESRVSIPPVEFGIEVREPVASEDHDNEVNNAIVGYSIAKVVDPSKENVGPTFDDNGNYNKTDWETGDRISEGKLNKIEDALDKINQNEKNDMTALDKRVTNNFNVLDAGKADKNEIFSMKNMGQDVKEAMTGGSVAVVGKNAILTENIVDGQVTDSKINNVDVLKINRDFWVTSEYINLFDKNDPDILDKQLIIDDGTIIPRDTTIITGYIPVNAPGVYYKNQKNDGNEVSLYDENKVFVGQIQAYSDGCIRIHDPAVKYARFTIMAYNQNASRNVSIDDFAVIEYPELDVTEAIDVSPAELNDYFTKVKLQNIPIDAIKEHRLRSTENLFDYMSMDNLYDYAIRIPDGALVSNTNCMVTHFIPVIPGGKYIKNQVNAGREVAFYDENKNIVECVDLGYFKGALIGFPNSIYNNIIHVPNNPNIRYMRVTFMYRNYAYPQYLHPLVEDFTIFSYDFEIDGLTVPYLENKVDKTKEEVSKLQVKVNELSAFKPPSTVTSTTKARPFILDTDWWTDSDDAVSIRVMTWAERCGMIDIVGICLDAIRSTSVLSLSTYLDYEGRPGLCFGADKQATDYNGTPSYHNSIIDGWPYHDYDSLDDVEDCVAFYRRALTSLPEDEQVDILCIGYGNALSRLLNSPADEYSELTGVELIKEKVRHLWFMAGKYLTTDGGLTYKGSENNFTRTTRSRVAGANICSNWPTAITFLGYEVGDPVYTGGTVGTVLGTSDLLYKSLHAHGGESEATKGRNSWDPMTMLLACMDDASASGYKYVYGTNVVDSSTGANVFTVNPTGPHRFVIKKYPNAWYAHQINTILEKRAWPYRPLGRVQLPRI